MATKGLNLVIGRLRRAALEQNGCGLSDSVLLEAYVKRRDESSFRALVHRHGGMVLGVCRRILGNEADAEDAFQATFLVLVRKAASVRPRGMLSNWLYGVAHNTALKARAMNHKRRIKEREAGMISKPQVDAALWQQVQALVDRELSHLPEKYRVAIVLCDLEGKIIKEAASHLNWPQGTLATRLKRGRALLAKRLSGHGLTLSLSVLTAVLAEATARASVPPQLFSATAKAATVFAGGSTAASAALSPKVVFLANGMVKLMLLSKLKGVSALVLVVAVLGFGAAACSFSSVGEHRPKNTAGSVPRAPDKQDGRSGKSKTAANADQLMRVLALEFDAKEFRLGNMTLKEFDGLLNEKLEARGAKMRVLVDVKAFKEESPGAPSVYDHVLVFPAAEAPRISVHFILRHVLNQLPVGAPKRVSQGGVVEIGAVGEPTLLFRAGAIWITTKTAARAAGQRSPRER
jgi:RNA polymerase sigma factor (sigma-70 family)